MTIMEFGAIGELVGGVAVVASLLFVGVQVRANTREQRAASMQEATRETANTVQYLTGPGYAEIWLQGMRDFQALDPADRLRFSAVLVHQTRIFEQLYYQAQADNVEHGLWLGFGQQLRDIAAYPGFQSWWEERKHWFSEQFRKFIETQMTPDNPPRLYETYEAEA